MYDTLDIKGITLKKFCDIDFSFVFYRNNCLIFSVKSNKC
jgi:hypothetical protein